MQKYLTSTVDEAICEGLDEGYRAMAADQVREAEALEWSNALATDMNALEDAVLLHLGMRR